MEKAEIVPEILEKDQKNQEETSSAEAGNPSPSDEDERSSAEEGAQTSQIHDEKSLAQEGARTSQIHDEKSSAQKGNPSPSDEKGVCSQCGEALISIHCQKRCDLCGA